MRRICALCLLETQWVPDGAGLSLSEGGVRRPVVSLAAPRELDLHRHGAMAFAKTVVGTDFSAGAEFALQHAVHLARKTGGEVTLVHAGALVDWPAGSDELRSAIFARLYEDYLGELRTSLRAARAQVERCGVAARHQLVEGVADGALPRVAADLGAELIAVGGGGGGRPEATGRFFGSVGERIARLSQTSVLLARAPLPAGGYRRVLIPVNLDRVGRRCGKREQTRGGRAPAPRARGPDPPAPRAASPPWAAPAGRIDRAYHSADVALACARLFAAPGAHVEIVYFCEPPRPLRGAAPRRERHLAAEGLSALWKFAAGRAGESLLDRHREGDWSLRFEPLPGAPRREIPRRAERAELVIVGGSSRPGLARAIAGSVPDAALRRAPCTVLALP